MPGWDGFSIPDWFAERYADAPVLVDNDVNIMALGEHWAHWRDVEHLLYVKVGTGIGCGIVAGRRIHRGAEGAAGDIGHIVVTDHEDVVCRCGNTAASRPSPAAARWPSSSAAAGYDVERSRDVVQLVREGNADAIRMVRDAGRALGEVLAALRQLLQPARDRPRRRHRRRPRAPARRRCARSSSSARCRWRRATCASSRRQLGDRAGITGAAIMVIEHILAPATIDQALRATA